jgi:hypothetical protein
MFAQRRAKVTRKRQQKRQQQKKQVTLFKEQTSSSDENKEKSDSDEEKLSVPVNVHDQSGKRNTTAPESSHSLRRRRTSDANKNALQKTDSENIQESLPSQSQQQTLSPISSVGQERGTQRDSVSH